MNSYYFSHDYSTRSDFKIKRLLQKHGILGYGIFWAVVEDLYNNDNSIDYDLDFLAYDLRVDKEIINSVLNDFDLFVVSDGKITSASIDKRLKIVEGKTNRARSSALERWGFDKKREKAKNCIFYIIRVYNQDEEFVKVGITTESVSRRYSGKLKGYDYELVFSHDGIAANLLEVESEINANFASYYAKIKFAGIKECYNISDLQHITHFAMQKLSIRNTIKEKDIKENNINKDIYVSNQFFETPDTQLPDLKKEDTDTHLGGAIAKPKFDFRKALLSLGANKLHVDEWMTIRNKKKAVNSEYAFATFLKELEKSGQHIDEVLKLCCQKQWRGFEASWITELPPKIEVKKSLASEIRNGL